MQRFADQSEILRTFERYVLRRSQRTSIDDQWAVAELASAGRVQNLTAERGAGIRIHVPAIRRGTNQQVASARSGLAQRHPERTNRIGVAGDLDPEDGIAIARLIGRRSFDGYPVPVRVELFRQDHRNRGVDALPHLHLRHDQGHKSIAVDANECVRRKPCIARRARRSRDRHLEADEQRSARSSRASEEASP